MSPVPLAVSVRPRIVFRHSVARSAVHGADCPSEAKAAATASPGLASASVALHSRSARRTSARAASARGWMIGRPDVSTSATKPSAELGGGERLLEHLDAEVLHDHAVNGA